MIFMLQSYQESLIVDIKVHFKNYWGHQCNNRELNVAETALFNGVVALRFH